MDVFKKDPKLPLILTAPTLTPGDKSQIVQELQKHTGGLDKADTVKNFLKTLADNNRLGILQGVCEKFTTLMGAARGEVDLTITSASVSLCDVDRRQAALNEYSIEAGYKDAAKAGSRGIQVRVQPGQQAEGYCQGTYFIEEPYMVIG